MRKKYFIYLFLIFKMSAIFCAAETFLLQAYADSENTFGSRFITPVAEMRISNRKEKWNFGISASTKPFLSAFPFVMKFGNLSPTEAIANLNNPSLSNGTSPFSITKSEPELLKTSLPSWTNFSKTESVFFQLEIPIIFEDNKNKQKFSNAISCWLTPASSEPIISHLSCLTLPRQHITLSIASTAGIFHHKENSSTSWFINSPYYSEGNHFSAIHQIFLEIQPVENCPILCTALTAGFYETPFHKIDTVLKSDFRITNKHSDFFISAFLNPNDNLLTSSDKKIASCLQLKSGIIGKNLVFKNFKNPFFLKTGINSFINLTKSQNNNYARINGGIQLSNSLTIFVLNSTIDFKINQQKLILDTFSFTFKNQFFFKYISLSYSFNSNLCQSKNLDYLWKIKLTTMLSIGETNKISASATTYFSQKKDQMNSEKISYSINGILKFKYLSLSGKIEANINL